MFEFKLWWSSCKCAGTGPRSRSVIAIPRSARAPRGGPRITAHGPAMSPRSRSTFTDLEHTSRRIIRPEIMILICICTTLQHFFSSGASWFVLWLCRHPAAIRNAVSSGRRRKAGGESGVGRSGPHRASVCGRGGSVASGDLVEHCAATDVSI